MSKDAEYVGSHVKKNKKKTRNFLVVDRHGLQGKVRYEESKGTEYVFWSWPTGKRMALKLDVHSNCTFVDIDGEKYTLPGGILFDLIGCAKVIKKANKNVFAKDKVYEVKG